MSLLEKTMPLTNYPHGVTSFGMPILGSGGNMTTGSVFFVHSGTGSDATANGKDPSAPFATWDYAIGRCAATNGDTIFIMEGHAETVTAAITMDVAGVTVIGLGRGRARPAITPSGAIDTVDVTAANCHIENVRLIGQAADSTASMNIAGDDCTVVNCIIEQGATPLVGVTIAGADRFQFLGCLFLGTAAGPDVGIDIETGDSEDWVVQDCTFNYVQSVGCDLAGIRASFKQSGGLVKNNNFIAMNVTAIDINSSVNALSDGLIVDNRIGAIAAVANIDTLIDAGGYLLCGNLGTDLPAEAGGTVPVTTPA